MGKEQKNANQGKEHKTVKRPVGPVRQGQLAQYEEPDRLTLQRAVARPDMATDADILALQRMVGNRAVTRLLSEPPTRPQHGNTARAAETSSRANSSAGTLRVKVIQKNDDPPDVTVQKDPSDGLKLIELYEGKATPHISGGVVWSKPPPNIKTTIAEFTALYPNPTPVQAEATGIISQGHFQFSTVEAGGRLPTHYFKKGANWCAIKQSPTDPAKNPGITPPYKLTKLGFITVDDFRKVCAHFSAADPNYDTMEEKAAEGVQRYLLSKIE